MSEARRLADTSVWVEFLRDGSDGRARALDGLLESEAVLTCGPVAAELLAGAKGKDRDSLWKLLQALPWAELDRDAWRAVGETAAELRSRGSSVPLTDIEIAVAAARAGSTIWSADRDFVRLAEVIEGLEVMVLESA